MKMLDVGLYPPITEFSSEQDRLIFLDTLWYECAKEWNDPRFVTRTHGSHKTYQAGCKGPICKRAVREQQRSRDGSEPRAPYTWTDPIIAEYHAIMKEQEEEALRAVREAFENSSFAQNLPEKPVQKPA